MMLAYIASDVMKVGLTTKEKKEAYVPKSYKTAAIK